MPFETLASLPDNVKKLSEAQQEVWRGAWNGRFKECEAEGSSAQDCESSAFAVANAAIKKELSPDEATKFYNGMVEGWDIYGAQFDQPDVNYNPLGASDAQGCANCRWFVAPGACIIVVNFPDPITPNGISDRWEAKRVFESEPLEVVIVGGSEHLDDDKDKATKKEGGVDYPASDFAVVPDSEKPSGWKLRLAEGSVGNQTVAQVGRAITALQPSGFRGNRVELSSEQKTSAIKKISGAIGRISGATPDQKTNLRERLDGVKEQRVQITVPQRLVNAVKSVLTPFLHEEPETPPPFVLYKDADGNVRWFAWMSNRWRDRDNPPEILSEKSHRDYVAYVDQSGHFPEAWLWHTPGTKWGQADWVDYSDGFLMVSGTVDPGMEHVAEALALQKDLGVSHGFRYRHGDAGQGIIDWYRTFEVSPLPVKAAANPWTSLEVMKKEIEMSMSKGKREFLVQHLGEAEVKRIEGNTEELKAALEAKGVEWKDVPEGGEGEGDKILKVGPEGIDMKALSEVMGKAAAEALVETPAFKGMVAKQEEVDVALKGLTDRIADLETSDDHKIAAAVGASNYAQRGFRASQSGDTTLSKAEAEAAALLAEPNIMDQIVEGMEIEAPTV